MADAENTGRQPQTSSEAAGTSQPQPQINTDIGAFKAEKIGVLNVGCVVEAQRNEEKEGSRIPLDIDDLDCTKLKRYFKDTLCRASPLPWYPEHDWKIHEIYTELALEGSLNKFGLEELFKQCPERFPVGVSYRILIEGDAGYGKSTLMLKIASDWSNDSNDKTNYTSRFSLLLVVKLGYIGEDGNLLSYMESIYNEKMDKPLEDVLKSKKTEKVLILLDGYDEANPNTKKEVDRIMEKEKMMDCHVVLTSRFGHAPDAVKSKALLVTVKGFGRKQVTLSVGKFFIKARHLTKADVISCTVEPVPLRDSDSDNELSDSDSDDSIRIDQIINSDDFQNVQENIPLLPEEKRLGLDQFKKFMRKIQAKSPYKKLAQCPLLCVMMCCLVSECPNRKLPSTCSGLYFAMINRNLYRATTKKDKDAKKVLKWNWKVLDRRIHKAHESYLQEFGRLCINGLKTTSMRFTLFDITGNEDDAETNDVKVNRLIEAGVLVQDLTELNTEEAMPRYQVPHRTTAEFLAAYYLSGETDQNLLQQNILDLFRFEASFNEVAVSLLEMGKPGCLVDAFRDIKFPSNCLRTIPFMKSYFTQHGAAGTWSEFKDALPNALQIETRGHDITVSSSEPSISLFQLFEEFVQMTTGNTNALRSLLPKDCLVSLNVVRTPSLPILLQMLVKTGAVLNSLEIQIPESPTCDENVQDVARSLRELLKSDSCPVQLSFTYASPDLMLAVIEAMQEVPKACRLRSFEFFPYPWCNDDTSPLSEVLAEKWLSHLQHLVIRYIEPSGYSPRDSPSGGRVNPILKGLREPGCSLTSLHLQGYLWDNNGDMVLEDLMMLATKLVTLSLQILHFHFNVTRISKYVEREKCSLKSLHLKYIYLSLEGSLPSEDENKAELLLGWRNVALNLEELTIDSCLFPFELISWLNLSVPNLRTLSIGKVEKWTPNDDTDSYATDSYATELLEALTRSSGGSIEELSLLADFWRTYKGLTLDPIEKALQRCPRIKKVKLELWESLPESIDPGPSTPSCSDVKALKSVNVYLALLRIVLSVPKLQSLTLTTKYRSDFIYFNNIVTFHAIADKAEKWPGKSLDNEWNTLTLHGLSNRNAVNAMHVFRERKLEHCLSYVAEEVYELSFPV